MPDASQISRRIKLRQLTVFIAVVEYGSMAKAAEHLSISQPVISKMIATLEQTLGVPLLAGAGTHRETNPVRESKAPGGNRFSNPASNP